MIHRTRLPNDMAMSTQVTGQGPAVVLIHGIPGSAAVWQGVVGQLADDHRVVVPDLLGFGQSSRPSKIEDLWADRQAEAVMAMLDELEIRDAIVVGHDFGGPVAAHLLDLDPARASALVLAASNTFGDTPIPFPLSGIFWPFVGRVWERLLFSTLSLRMMIRQGSGSRGPRLDPARYVGDRAQARVIATIFSTALRELRERYDPITSMLERVHVPARVIWGDDDPFFPVSQAYRTAALIPGANLEILAGAGHFLPEERPRELAGAVLALSVESA